ncbi:MAG TPA: isoprenylcysteine carboxylmethyltransferase family protein [Terriglobales bacterium]|nr:isoprenylcysteine carboxylmethyltransferase family protein [Terriglobales bacterium]
MGQLLRAIWLPAAVILAIWGWLWLDRRMAWHGPQQQLLGGVLLVLGSMLVLWCFWLFLHLGKGSPHPFVAKTQRLVSSGPYGYVRNPMMWGVGAILIGLALCLGSVGLWFGFAGFVVFLRFFVRGYEEPDLRRRFGAEYEEYCRRVPRWWPRLRR